MLKHRVIARMDIKPPNLVKTIRMEGLRKLGNPHEFAKVYADNGIDEILYLDIVASLYGRNNILDLVSATAEDVFVPITVGGGIRSVDDARDLLLAGADKVAVNTAALERPELLNEIADKFGSQCLVAQIDAKQVVTNTYAYSEGGRQSSAMRVQTWALEAQTRGAGEILLTSIDQEGTGDGYDLKTIRQVSPLITVPLIASGGFGQPLDAIEAIKAGADAVAIAGALHYSKHGVPDIKQCMAEWDIPVRPAA